jgi:hypothetical protein
MSNPTLIITGTHNNNVPPANSLIIAGKIPGAWLCTDKMRVLVLVMEMEISLKVPYNTTLILQNNV